MYREQLHHLFGFMFKVYLLATPGPGRPVALLCWFHLNLGRIVLGICDSVYYFKVSPGALSLGLDGVVQLAGSLYL